MLQKLVPKPIRSKLYHLLYPKSPVLWANWSALSKILAKTFQLKQPPVVILSMPRSGSSWVGEILGLSLNSLYLREPITQTYLKTRETGPSFFELDEDNLPDTYKQSAEYVFSGLPLFDKWITKHPDQWGLLKRKQKRIVAKEVNPFMLGWLIKHFKPRIIYLLRHPAAVADSFNRLGYNGKQLESRLSRETLQKYPDWEKHTNSFWADHGAMQAIVLNEMLNTLKIYKDFQLIQYEHLCQNPIAVFKKLYDYAELEWSVTIEESIRQRSCPQAIDTHDFSTQRNSAYEMNKWKDELSQDIIQQIKDAWLSLNPAYYGPSEW